MTRTFADYLHKTGGKEPKEVVSANEYVPEISGKFAASKNITRQQEHPEHKITLRGLSLEAALDSDVFGEEAENARCETCNLDMLRDGGTECEGCGGFFGRHGKGRNNCWRNHNCGKLITLNGFLVKEGDILVYPSHSDEFTVLKTEGTWIKGGHARGLRHRGRHEMPIIPRLMSHKEAS